MSRQFKPGDVVTLRANLYEGPDEYAPGGYLAMAGDKLIVREVRPQGQWPIAVSHDYRTDGAKFVVAADELELLQAEQAQPTPTPGDRTP